MADKYVLRVTAGPTYDLTGHQEVPVNAPDLVKVSTELMDVELSVRIQNFKGLPRNSPSTSPYFSHEPHATNKDQYSIAFRFTPKDPSTGGGKDPGGISGADLQFGNDFDHPIRDRLPPGFSYAMKIVKWWIDPGLDGDPYADSPYLFGPALSSCNTIHVGPAAFDEAKGGLWVEEGASDADAKGWRQDVGAPSDGKARMKWALQEQSKEDWVWEYGRTYAVDFFNAYIDFSEFALRLPGYAVPIMKYWDGQGLRKKRSHQLRYVLRNRTTKQVYLVILFTLYLKEDVNEDGSLKPEAARAYTAEAAPLTLEQEAAIANEEDAKEPDFDGEAALEAARKHLGDVDLTTATQKDNTAAAEDDDID
ncbi:DUF1769-domain-containing protein [Cryphonectria parasitica EP155]|uniref:DUF1769-domain-containing protein n=1 Tax=Cryphonectria parasitica (strain ATCC 38755 / EP155) TaxID=660469 RepID=A0A9P4XWD5_CRYP1|nr:DUF1769-domain-containing protein [Cryphonectria parasitica EP155]KAF3762128.1 DUF1769-domain-containing protein [Cryphonectria parasitica EP155]